MSLEKLETDNELRVMKGISRILLESYELKDKKVH